MDIQKVHFDFHGALSLARSLWDMAESIDNARPRRSRTVNDASAPWVGPHGNTFRSMASDELQAMSSTASGLRADAESWAAAWAEATNEFNRISYEYAITRERESRSVGERTFDIFVGDDSADEVGPPPEPVQIPVAPGFFPTGAYGN